MRTNILTLDGNMDINDSRYLPSTNFFYSGLVSQQTSSYLFFCFEIPKVFEEF